MPEDLAGDYSTLAITLLNNAPVLRHHMASQTHI